MNKAGKFSRSNWENGAIIVPAAILAAESSWQGTFAAGAVAVLLGTVRNRSRGQYQPCKVNAAARMTLLTLILARFGQILMQSWEGKETGFAVALILITLAARSGAGRTEKSRAIARVLAPFLLAGETAMVLFGLADGAPIVTDTFHMEMHPLLLTAFLLPLTESGERGSQWKTAAEITVLSILVNSAIGSREPVEANRKLLSWIQGLCIGGEAVRLEAPFALVMTAGWYCFFTGIFRQIREAAQVIKPEIQNVWIYAVAAMVLMVGILENRIIEYTMAAGIVALWLIIPGITGVKKKFKKFEKKG